jgi:hypothetical protein
MGFAQSTMRPRKNAWGKTITAPGCDDAPVVEIAIGDVAKRVTLIIPYFENPKTFADRLRGYENICGRMPVSMIVVDDCSPVPLWDAIDAASRITARSVPGLRIYRITEKKRFNWLAARNIAAHEAEDGSWLAMTDMDHMLPFTTTTALVYGSHDPETIYRFTRCDGHHSAETEIAPHANSWFMTKAMFWRAGGYNEAFSGLYGSDGEFRRRCARTAPIAIMNRPLVRKEHDGDSSTTSYGRKEPQDRAIHELAAQLEGTPPKVLSFPYERVL